jgi:hypothetical protein
VGAFGRALRFAHAGVFQFPPVETVQDILESIGYSIGIALKGLHDDRKSAERLCTQSLPSLFTDGQRRIEHMMHEGRQLLARLQAATFPCGTTFMPTPCFRRFRSFFAATTHTFSAHETVCDLDYPLSCPVGICAASSTSTRICAAFCWKTRFARIFRVRTSASAAKPADGRSAFVNLCDLVFCSAVGQALLHKNIVE